MDNDSFLGSRCYYARSIYAFTYDHYPFIIKEQNGKCIIVLGHSYALYVIKIIKIDIDSLSL